MNKYLFIILFFASLDVFSFDKTFNEVKENYKSSDLTILDRSNNVLDKVRIDNFHRTLEWTSINEVSHAFKSLLIKSEDKNFYEHNGVDWKALIKASFERMIDSNSRRGASTISMQLINVLDPNLKGIKKGYTEKFDQIKESLDLEKKWSKDQILEAYINIVPFRGELIGLKVASFTFFNKAPHALNNIEAAILVAMLRSPNASVELITGRTCRLLTDESCQKIYQKVTSVINNRVEVVNNKEFVNILDKSFILSKDKQFIRTTLSKDVQDHALTSLHEQIKSLKNQNLTDGAILVINNVTKEVIAYVPNAGDKFSTSPRFDNIRARRQAGSTLKPFIYAKAFEDNLLTPESLIDDSPIDIPIGKGSIYSPRNYDNQFYGKVQAKLALGSSLNVPAVKALLLVGGENTISVLKNLGFNRLESADYYGPSLALGSVDVTLWDLTQAYFKLGNSNIFNQRTKDILFDVLSDPENRYLTFGTNSVLSLPFNVAVKTGTSKDMRDNWCVGYSKYFTVGVWVGNSSGKSMYNVSGITGAAPIFRKVMLRLHKDFAFSNKLNQLSKIDMNNTLEDNYLTKINYPVDGEVIGYDNEIPEHLQILPIEISNSKSKVQVYLNDNKLENLMWKISRGKYELTLRNEMNNVLQTVKFEVR